MVDVASPGCGWQAPATRGQAEWRARVRGPWRRPAFCSSLQPCAERELGFDAGNGAEHGAADACESIGVANRGTILRDGGIEAAHRVVDVGGRHEITGNGLREF